MWETISKLFGAIANELPVQMVVQILDTALVFAAGYIANEIGDKIKERRRFRPGITLAMDICLEMETKMPGQGIGTERFKKAVRLYTERSGERDKGKAEQIVAAAFQVSSLWHNNKE